MYQVLALVVVAPPQADGVSLIQDSTRGLRTSRVACDPAELGGEPLCHRVEGTRFYRCAAALDENHCAKNARSQRRAHKF